MRKVYAMPMTRYIQRTVTITVIETLLLLWDYTTHDDATLALDAVTTAAPLVGCALTRVTVSVHTTLLPACKAEEAP
jgi:hypothetical protein